MSDIAGNLAMILDSRINKLDNEFYSSISEYSDLINKINHQVTNLLSLVNKAKDIVILNYRNSIE